MFHFIGRMLAAFAIFIGIAVTGASASEIFIQSALTNGFVRQNAGVMVANGHADNAIRFTMVRLGGERVAFRAPNGTYLRAGVTRDTLLAIGSPQVGGWETFEMVRFLDGVGLKSVQNGKFVEVERRSGRMSATGGVRATQALFRLVGAPGQGAGQGPRVDWTGRWAQLWVASNDGRLLRPPQGGRVDFTISTGREVEANVGCNQMRTRLSVDGRSVRFTPVMMTKKGCPGALGDYERALAHAFGQVVAHEVREGQVAFIDNRGRTLFQIAR